MNSFPSPGVVATWDNRAQSEGERGSNRLVHKGAQARFICRAHSKEVIDRIPPFLPLSEQNYDYVISARFSDCVPIK